MSAPLLMLLPALVWLPLLLVLPALCHGGGWELIGQFAVAAVRPSLDPLVLASALRGLGITVGIALLGWAASLVLGLVGGAAQLPHGVAHLLGQGVAGGRDPATAGAAALDP